LINQLAASPRPIILAFDDYHVIQTPAIHEGIGYLLDHQPPQLHLVLVTRADPPLSLARLRGQRDLTEIRVGDLRFSAQETGVFLNEIMALDLPEEDIDILATRTEGWAVGLVLAAQSMSGRDDKQRFIKAFSGSHHYILEYLIEEVLSRQSPDTQEFLLRTSVLERLCGPLCDAMMDGDNSQQILRQLQRENLFVIPLDEDGRWFRYHHLFTDLLGNLRRNQIQAQEIGELNRRASLWYEQNEFFDEAVQHALLSDDVELAAAIIERSAWAAIAQGRVVTFLGWAAGLPDAQLQARPRLRIQQAWALHLNGDHKAAETILLDTRTRLHSAPPSGDLVALQGQIAAMLVVIAAMQEDSATVIREAGDALTCLPEDDLNSRARVYVALGTAQAYDDDLESAVATWERARELALATGNPFLAAAAVELLAGIRIYHQGRLREGARLLRHIIELGTTADGKPLPFTTVAHILLAEVHLEWNDLQAAAHFLEVGIDLAQRSGVAHGLTHTYCTEARLCQAVGDQQGASTALAAAAQLLQGRPLLHMVVHQITCQVRFRLWSGDVAGASRWATADMAIVGRDLAVHMPAYLAEIQRIAQAQVCLAQDDPLAAQATLDALLPGAVAGNRPVRVAEIQLYRALALRQIGDLSGAMDAFEECLSITEAEGHIRLYIEVGQPIVPLLHQAASRAIFTVYVAKLLAAFGPASGPGSAGDQQQEKLIDPLSQREQQVLNLLNAGHTNREIADLLVVSLNTVKKHTGNIYSKLGVHSRTQAVARARQLGLL
jgi:LuxR family maltose regulon positive regulatory protein